MRMSEVLKQIRQKCLEEGAYGCYFHKNSRTYSIIHKATGRLVKRTGLTTLEAAQEYAKSFKHPMMSGKKRMAEDVGTSGSPGGGEDAGGQLGPLATPIIKKPSPKTNKKAKAALLQTNEDLEDTDAAVTEPATGYVHGTEKVEFSGLKSKTDEGELKVEPQTHDNDIKNLKDYLRKRNDRLQKLNTLRNIGGE